MSIPLLVLADDPFLHHPENLAAIPGAYDVRTVEAVGELGEEQLLDACRSAEVILTGRKSRRLPEELIDDPGRLRWLCHHFGTIKHLVSKDHLAAGLTVTNWGTSFRSLTDGAILLLMAQLKQLITLNDFVKTGRDRRIYQAYPPHMRGLKVGLYGYGPIGRQVRDRLAGLGCELAIYDPYARNVPAEDRVCASLEELFATCWAVLVLCGLNDTTRGSVTGGLLDRLPQGGILVNVARGPIVDEQALADRVAAGKLLAACDVIQKERDWPGSPLAPLDGAILTGHKISTGKGYPPGSEPLRPIAPHVVDNLRAYAAGQPLQHVIALDEYDLKT